MARSNYGAGKRAREAEKARKKRDKDERRRRKREEGPKEVPIATADEVQVVSGPDPDPSAPPGEKPVRRGQPVRLFVGGLSWDTDEQMLKEAFTQAGEVLEAVVVLDHDGRSRGFGFVTMADQQGGKKALTELDGQELDGRYLKVSPARER